MARTKYKIDQYLKTDNIAGVVSEIHLRKTEAPLYVLADGSKIEEADVEAVFRPVVPRKVKPKAARKPKEAKAA